VNNLYTLSAVIRVSTLVHFLFIVAARMKYSLTTVFNRAGSCPASDFRNEASCIQVKANKVCR
jgi:hypothetical protein